MNKHFRALAMSWLVFSGLFIVLLFALAEAKLRLSLADHLQAHLLLSLDESNFSSADNRVNDNETLSAVGLRINQTLRDVVQSRWYAPLKECEVGIARIDGAEVSGAPTGGGFALLVPRNQIERRIDIGYSCSRNWAPALLGSAMLAVLVFLLVRVLPAPLSRKHRYWINYLLGRDYDEAQAIEIVSVYTDSSLTLNRAQQACLEQLHDEGERNFAAALRVATDSRVAALAPGQVDWLLLGLGDGLQDLDRALALANAPDEVLVDLAGHKLLVRGLEVPVGTTPLFYYAWYARRRLDGDGWVSNPASNRPDPEAGRELVELMRANGGHARAINDLEQAGLKARTLDQNRSKIKDEMVAVLGEKLARLYLFEGEKDADGLHMRYRLTPGRPILRLLE